MTAPSPLATAPADPPMSDAHRAEVRAMIREYGLLARAPAVCLYHFAVLGALNYLYMTGPAVASLFMSFCLSVILIYACTVTLHTGRAAHNICYVART
jgi:hypothetical protein